MVSNIDATKPTSPMAYTADVRGNFATTKSEIEALQGVTVGGPFLPLSGSTVTGATTFNAGLTSQYPGTANRLVSQPTHPSAAYVPGSSQLFSYMVAAAAGGNRFDVIANSQFYSSITGAPNTFVFNNLNVVDYAGSGGQSQLVATYNQAIRRTRSAGGVSNNPEIFGAVFEAIDFTNSDSAASSGMNGIEIDMTCGNTDSAHNRRGFGMYLNRANGGDVAPVVSTGMHLAANVGSYDTVLKIETPFNIAAIDLRQASAVTGAAHQIWLGTAGTIALDTSASFTLSGDGIGGMVMTSVAGQPSRIIYQSARTWWSGTWADGSYYIADTTAGASRVTIDPSGLITLGGALGGTTATFNTLNITASATGDDPLSITTAAGHYARARYTVAGVRTWSQGCFPDGAFRLTDETGAAIRMSILTNGNVQFTNSFALANKTPPTIPTGYTTPTGTATRGTFATSSVTLSVLAEHVKALIDDLTAYALIGP